MDAQDDAGLLERATAGDADALSTLLARHGPAVARAIYADIGAPWRALLDAEDVMQVTYLEAFLHAEHIAARDGVGFAAWLRRIAQNNLRDALRELDRAKRPSPARRVHAGGGAGSDSHVALIEMLGATSATPSRHVAQREAVQVLDTLLQRMPPDYATVIRRYDLDERPVGEVAAELGRSAGAVYMLRARAHDLLRDLLLSETDILTRAT